MSETTTVKAVAPQLNSTFHDYQAFILALKINWSTTFYRSILQEAEEFVATEPNAVAENIEQGLGQRSFRYAYFAWLEHYLQQFKYMGRHGIMNTLQPQAPALSYALEGSNEALGSLLLDPTLALPTYYTSTDFHEHPGGVWSDPIDAFAYEVGAGSTTPIVSDHADLHFRYASFVANLCKPDAILDLGCGFGKTTLPMKRVNPTARVVGIDLSEPCLRLAHIRAAEAGVNIEYAQMPAESLSLEDRAFDAVTGSMLIHEMPPTAVRAALAESYRVLRSGGWLALLDFYVIPGGEIGRFFHLGHSARNEEPFMRTLLDIDLEAELSKVGFTDIRIEPFEEADNALVDGMDIPRSWRFPWTIIAARKD